MLDNVGGFGAAERTDLRLERLYQWARECAVKYDFLSIPTSQVSVEGEGLAWCDMSMLKDSKCLGVNTPIRMFDGSTKLVQNVTIGDRVLGIDSDARSVVGTGTGMQQMYNVAGHGWAFQCNEDHILTTIKSTARPMNGHKKGDIIDLPLRYFLNNPSRLSHYKAVRVRANYPEAALSMDPYFLGLWLGDGSSKEVKVTAADCEIKRWLENHKDYQHTYIQPVPPGRKPLWDVYHTGGRALLRTTGVYKNKRIPQGYKMSSVNQRRALLAGLMDSDGTIDSGSCSITMSRQALIEDINEVAKSLGYRSATRKAGANAWTVQFANTEPLPVLLARKRCICKLRQDTMTITKLGMGRYYGFTVDGDARYTLGCYIATHNTAKQGACEAIITMGATSNLNQEWSRFLYVPKTKYTPLKGHRADCASEVQFNGATCQFSESPKVEDIPI
jgi:replicative DNA helicase